MMLPLRHYRTNWGCAQPGISYANIQGQDIEKIRGYLRERNFIKNHTSAGDLDTRLHQVHIIGGKRTMPALSQWYLLCGTQDLSRPNVAFEKIFRDFHALGSWVICK